MSNEISYFKSKTLGKSEKSFLSSANSNRAYLLNETTAQ